MLKQGPSESLQVASGAARAWPNQRGVFRSLDRTVTVHCNGAEDHCTMIVLQHDHDAVGAFRKLCAVHETIQEHLQTLCMRFVESEQFGYLGLCPSNVGTAFFCQVVLMLPTAGKVRVH